MGLQNNSVANVHEVPPSAEKHEVEDGPQDEDNTEYPSGFKLVVILVAIFLSLILTGLVRSVA